MPRTPEDTSERPDGEQPLCSVLVPILNEENHIEATVRAMQAQRFQGPMEFLLVDGGSTDRTGEILETLAREDPRIRLLHNRRREIPSGLNVGLRHARGRWIARMDAHARYPSDYIQRGVERLRTADTHWVSGPQIPEGGGPVARATALALGTVLGRGASGRWGSKSQPEATEYKLDSGVFCGVWARDTLIAYGGWDERWSRNEDSEMAGRFFEHGEVLICVPGMAAAYSPRDSLPALWRQYLKNGGFRALTARHHPDTLRRSNLLPPALALTCCATVAGPARLRRAARVALAGYASVAVALGARASTAAEAPVDAALVPVVMLTMHLAYGLGFLRGTIRHGAPVAALLSAAGFEHMAERLRPPGEPVFAPSLQGD
jgi:glycosyltransferase involved in cell wall biosynthesis